MSWSAPSSSRKAGASLPRISLRQAESVEPIPLPAGFLPCGRCERVERQMIERALEAAAGVKVEAARLLEIKPSVLYYKLEKYGLIDSRGNENSPSTARGGFGSPGFSLPASEF